MSRLIDAYDAALFDLDGVVYLGPEPVEQAPEALARLRAEQVKVGFVTNNAARKPGVVVEHLQRLGIACQVSDVVTSAQAIAALMAKQLPEGATVFVCGAQALADEIEAVGLRVVSDHTHSPQAVVQGYDPNIAWSTLDEACFAIQRGATWYASNTDLTRPTNLGLVPGAGSQLRVVAAAVEGEPIVAGKPYPPLLNETTERLATSRPLFVGDRLDTDIEGAVNVGMDSFMVFTGAHGKRDLVYACPAQRPTAIDYDLRGLFEPARVAQWDGDEAICGQAKARLEASTVIVDGPLETLAHQLDALWAACQVTWAAQDADIPAATSVGAVTPEAAGSSARVDAEDLLARLDLVP